jgi:hypothetical protein
MIQLPVSSSIPVRRALRELLSVARQGMLDGERLSTPNCMRIFERTTCLVDGAYGWGAIHRAEIRSMQRTGLQSQTSPPARDQSRQGIDNHGK